MTPGTHFDPSNTTTYMAENTTVRIILAIAAAHNCPCEHLDIKAAYLQEKYENDTPVHKKQYQQCYRDGYLSCSQLQGAVVFKCCVFDCVFAVLAAESTVVQ